MVSSGPSGPEVRDAYRHCERVTRQQARNFAYGIALLPPGKRRALSAVYALARRIDDIGDGTMPAAEKLAALAGVRRDVAALVASAPGTGSSADNGGPGFGGDQVLLAVADTARRLGVPVAAFGELIDGCEADVRGTRYETFDELEHYCRCVAGSIGRLSLGVFGSDDPAGAAPLADALGVALQLTNILRDIREDLGTGRIYLPAADIAAFGCTIAPQGPDGQPVLTGDLAGLVRFEAERAARWYATGMRLLPMLDRRSAACTGAMAGIYRRLLDHIASDPHAALSRRLSLPAREKTLVAMVSLTGFPRRQPVADGAAPRLASTPGDSP